MWTVTDHLLDDIRMALTGSKKKPAKPHPQRPKGKAKRLNPRRLADGMRRRQERKRALERGEIT